MMNWKHVAHADVVEAIANTTGWVRTGSFQNMVSDRARVTSWSGRSAVIRIRQSWVQPTNSPPRASALAGVISKAARTAPSRYSEHWDSRLRLGNRPAEAGPQLRCPRVPPLSLSLTLFAAMHDCQPQGPCGIRELRAKRNCTAPIGTNNKPVTRLCLGGFAVVHRGPNVQAIPPIVPVRCFRRRPLAQSSSTIEVHLQRKTPDRRRPHT